MRDEKMAFYAIASNAIMFLCALTIAWFCVPEMRSDGEVAFYQIARILGFWMMGYALAELHTRWMRRSRTRSTPDTDPNP